MASGLHAEKRGSKGKSPAWDWPDRGGRTTLPERSAVLANTAQHAHLLTQLGDTDLTLANPDADIRGRDVLDANGDKIGTVDGLIIDTEERKVRFLKVAHGGFLGIGEDHFLVPVDAVQAVTDDNVRINRAREDLNRAPGYNPDLVQKANNYYEDLYGWWGYAPYWTAGYAYPSYPVWPY